MDAPQLSALLEQTGTPAYVFQMDEFAARAQAVREAFTDRIGLCFSIKANAFLLKHLPAQFDRIEVCSPGELTICEKTGQDMEKVIFSGVNKTAPDVARAISDNVGVLTAESLLHVRLINDEALRQGKRVRLLLRLTAGSQFGMDEAEVLSTVETREQLPGVDIIGLHFFSGTQKRKLSVIEKELAYLDEFCTRVREQTGFSLRCVEYGTGLGVEYFKPDYQDIELDRLQQVSVPLRAFAEKYALTVEMGRFFAAPCGYYLTKVIDCKTNKGVRYAILDGGLHQLKYDGQLQGMQIPPILHLDAEDRLQEDKWTLCGSLCTTADVIARDVPLRELRMGDVLAFCRTGAYSVTEGMANFLSRELPSVTLVSQEHGAETVRPILATDIFNTP